MRDENMMLTVKSLSLYYKDRLILQDLDFSIRVGEFLTVIGPNGTGKTTLIKAVSRNLKSVAGSIFLQGRNINDMSRQALARQMAIVMQNVEPLPMNVRSYVLMGRLPFFEKYQFFEKKKDIDIAEKYMNLTHVNRFAEARMDEISSGERQLASIARALTQEPAVLVLDEPIAHLDITHQVKVLELIQTLSRNLDLTVLMVLHDLNLAAEYSDSLLLLDKKCKRIYSIGNPFQVLTQEAVQHVYNTDVLIQPNPISGRPCIFLTSQSNQE